MYNHVKFIYTNFNIKMNVAYINSKVIRIIKLIFFLIIISQTYFGTNILFAISTRS